MQKLFLGIYGAIFASTVLVLAVAYYALESVNQFRYQSHLKNTMYGSVRLLNDGIARQPLENRERWIELATELMGAKMRMSYIQLTDEERYSITHIPPENEYSERYQLRYQQAGSTQQLELLVSGISEQIVTATAFFMLNELGRLPAAQRQQSFDQMVNDFTFGVERVERNALGLDTQQLERLSRGESIVQIETELGQGLSINVYSPWGNSNDALALGPITTFDPYPTHIVAGVLVWTLLTMAFSVMFIIRRVANRLITLQHIVDDINPEYVKASEPLDNTDVITTLNAKIKTMAARIQKLLDDKAYMIRAVSHDLRTPISKIHFRLEGLTDKLGDDHPAVLGCQNDLRQLNLLIDELLTYEKLSEKQRIEFQSIDLRALLFNQVEGLKVLWPALDVSLSNDNTCQVSVEGNEILLNRLFENLLQNAAKYAKSEVTVRMSQQNSDVVISIEDDGIGLDESSLHKLFEPFFKVESSRSSSDGGYGLGLAIVKQIAFQHGATIAAENRTDGGALFRLTLPRKATRHD